MAEDGQTGKAAIRHAMKVRKAALTAAEKNVAGIAVATRLEQCPEFISARHVLLYHALPDELQTRLILERWAGRKLLYLPRVKGNELEILPFGGGASLHSGAFGIREPEGNATVDVGLMDLIIVPGVAFDFSGNRLGRGKGFYDRLLCAARCPLIGIAYDFQVVEVLPAESHDIPMTRIITDKRDINLQKRDT